MCRGWLGGGKIEQKGRRTHGHGWQCGDCWGEVDMRGLIGNGKNTIKINFFKERKCYEFVFENIYMLLFNNPGRRVRLFFFFYSVTIVCIFSPSLHPTPASPTSFPHLYPPPWFKIFFNLLIFRERGGDNIHLLPHPFMHPLVDSCMCPNQGMESTNLVCWNDALTNWAMWSGLLFFWMWLLENLKLHI